MKKILTTLALAVMIIIAGCTDLDDVHRRLEEQKNMLSDHEARLKALENMTNTVNTEISAIKTLIDAMGKKISVVSYAELSDKSGYELTMSDGSKIALKHGTKGKDGADGKDGKDGADGKDGKSPVINVKKHSDGLLYWTINGEFMRDANGKMIPAQGKDGADGADGAPGVNGVTPQMRVNTLLQWEVSLDGGKTWQTVKGANGKPISAQGPKGEKGEQGEQGQPGNDGDANLSISETADAIIIVYKGVTYTLPKGGGAPPAGFSITMTTAKAVGEKIRLKINAAEADRDGVWIDLNNNGQQDGESEKVTQFDTFIEYTLGAKTVTLHGKVSYLECSENQLTALDVSNNTKLVILYCPSNQLQTLDVSNNKELTDLFCYGNQLETLDISNNKELIYLVCYNNQLETLDVSNNTKLYYLDCSKNQLETLDVSNNTKLYYLDCGKNQLETLDVSNNKELTNLSCYINQLQTLDFSNNTKLNYLDCRINQLETLDVSNNKELKYLWCYNNKINDANMTALINSMPTRPAAEKGEFYPKISSVNEQNVFTPAHRAAAEAKNWEIKN